MYCFRQVKEDLYWVGANDRRLAMFEGVYSVPDGVSYNAYLLLDEKTVLFDTVDKAVEDTFYENVEAVLGARELDFVVVHHMEPDHSATLAGIVRRYPKVKIICNAKIAGMMKQFFTFDVDSRVVLVKEGDSFCSGKHTFAFVMAPMVHWPEVMMSYDTTDHILYSADAFGCFGALNGALFADEVNFERDYMDEARRYYTNIVGKYGTQVQAVLKKAAGLKIDMICPLHGFVWRKGHGEFISKYLYWSSYTPEENGVMIAYASVYGHTENAAEVLACRLREAGIRTVMYDVSVTPASDIIAACFQWSHLVFASTTYNAGIFVNMEALLHDLAAHNIQNRTVALIENGSWAATSGRLMREILEKCKGITFVDPVLSVKSSVRPDQLAVIDEMVKAIADTMPKAKEAAAAENKVDANTMFKLSYGLFVLTAKEGSRDNGCIINTTTQITAAPNRIAIAVNKANATHDMIKNTGVFNVSVISVDASFGLFQHFGFQSGRDVDKFAGFTQAERAENGLMYVTEGTNGVISGKVIETRDYGTHTLFVAEVTEAKILSAAASATYQYYFDHIKPKPQPTEEKKKGFVCKICGYVYEGEVLPADFICPLCKHGAEDFEPLS
ncbi:MAG: flavin reductase [Lachnospiraceae bacterium]|nr:flavin reductase [Lachnospiraceae bacterium]